MGDIAASRALHSGNIAFVRTHSTTSVCLLHGLVLLPCGISGKMIIPSKSLLSLLASTRSIAMLALPATIDHASLLPCQTSDHPVLATVVWLCHRFCSAPLIALLVAGEVEVCSLSEHGYVGISQYLLFN